MDTNETSEQSQASLEAILGNMISIAAASTRQHDRNDTLMNAHFLDGVGLVSWTHVENDLQLDIRQQPELTDPVSLEIACTLEKAGESWTLSQHDRSFTINIPEPNGGQHAFANVSLGQTGTFTVEAEYGLLPTDDQLAAAGDFSARMLRAFEADHAAI